MVYLTIVVVQKKTLWQLSVRGVDLKVSNAVHRVMHQAHHLRQPLQHQLNTPVLPLLVVTDRMDRRVDPTEVVAPL